MQQHSFRSHDGTQITWYQTGLTDGPTLILANGLGGNIATWRHVINRFESSFRIICWDYRGLFNSGKAPTRSAYTVSHHARDLKALLDHSGVVNPTLIGWSMGVQVNFEFCRQNPGATRGIVALNGVPGKPLHTAFHSDVLHRRQDEIFSFIRRHMHRAWKLRRFYARDRTFMAFVRAMQVAGIAAHSLDDHAMLVLMRDWARSVDLRVYSDIFQHLGKHDVTDFLPHVQAPTLVVSGTRDRFTPPARSEVIADLVPDSELFSIPGGTHFCPVEYPELLNARLCRFFKDHALDSHMELPLLAAVG